MVKVTCINDQNKPAEIPTEDWVIAGEDYHVTHVSLQVNQLENGGIVLGCDLYEKPLSIEKHNPYECFRLHRFAIEEDRLHELIDLIKDCIELPNDKNIRDLIKESKLQLV